MTSRITVFFITLLFFCPSLSLAQEIPADKSARQKTAAATFRNPFLPQIPPPKKPEERPDARKALRPKLPKNKNAVPTKKGLSANTPPGILPSGQVKIKQEGEEAAPQLPPLDISGLIWNSDRPQAIINSTILDIGDELFINETAIITITDIQKDTVKVFFQGEDFTLNTQ